MLYLFTVTNIITISVVNKIISVIYQRNTNNIIGYFYFNTTAIPII
jgi:hypothetical protein